MERKRVTPVGSASAFCEHVILVVSQKGTNLARESRREAKRAYPPPPPSSRPLPPWLASRAQAASLPAASAAA